MTERNIVLCLDGTSNEWAKDLTNVAKLTYAMLKDPARQHIFYNPGLGTMAAPGYPLPLGNAAARGAGLAFGYGIKDDLAEAYKFIMNHWRPGDHLYLFGFSRGAYTARALASLLRLYGVAMPGNEAMVPYLVRMLWSLRGDDHDIRKERYDQARRFKRSLALPCRPHFVGVWDTVSSVGWVGSPVALPFTRVNEDIAIFRHAVAIDERRAFFRTNLFQASPGQSVSQLWFPGDHCDVGGGHPEEESGLSKYALEWMATEAAGAGLVIDRPRLDELLWRSGGAGSQPTPGAMRHESLTLRWRPFEYAEKWHWDNRTGQRTRRQNRGRRRSMLAAPLVHPVAWEIAGYADRLPSDAVKLDWPLPEKPNP
ncbi:Uncharacterized protein, PA2063/DUF2235 family [Sphingopyxis sp. YR583]|uniref:DUF2235 domain-containing protein n=1 Tax=Sphingopyxis sp. YR583 TaxID=1881047 RepID=UPI0008A799F8|nr:DUF2235 domain-containing protein [Sphingopyxis sp. YR583]SEH12649.1 Uncharacterized protein, PA2063/DUF2235 family [Sphingopyxis sp. YR583]